MKTGRNVRVSGEFQKEIYEIITKKLKNPSITEMFSIVKVDTSPDLSHSKVFISVFSGTEQSKASTFKAIADSAKQIRFELSKVMRMRKVPELRFIMDDGEDYSAKMDRLFDQIHKEEDK